MRRWQIAVAAGDERRADDLRRSMAAIARDGVVMAAAISELGQDLTRPQTTATRTPSGWRIDGRKAFCTMSPAATVLYTAVTFVDDDGVERYGYAQVPTDAAGRRDPRRLGRARHARLGQPLRHVHGVELPRAALRGGFLAGDADAYMDRNLVAGLFHASASLGIAESAAAAVAGAARRRAASPTRARARCVAENAIELGACRATLARAATLVDESDERHSPRCSPRRRRRRRSSTRPPRGSSTARSRSRAAPATSTATRSRARTATSAPAAFMHPLGANRAYDLLGDVALGRELVLH